MAKQQIKVGFTDYTTLVFIPDPASTDGSGKTGLVAANLTVSGTRVENDNDVTVIDYTSSLNNLAALTTAHTDWGLLEVSSTLCPGLYRLDIADAIFASGAWSAVVYVMITTSAAAASPMEFTLVGFDQNDGVRMGLTALPNAAADAAGGLVISDAGGLDADAQRADVAAILVDTGTTLDARIPAALVGGRMDSSVGAMAANTITAAATAADFTTEVTTGLALEATLATTAAYIDTEVAAIKAKTDNLPTDPADESLIIAATDAIMSRLGAPVGASMSADVAAVKAETATILADTNDIQTRLPAALVSGRMDASVGAMAANVMTAAAAAADLTTELQAGLSTLDAAGVRTAVGLASANLDTQLTAIDDFLDTEVGAIKAKTDLIPAAPAAVGDIPTAAVIADAVWDEALAGHLTAGSTGNALNAAGAAGDPWSTALPGAYGSGTAGKIIGDNINATISSRASQTSVDTVDDFLDTEIAAIKAKTDNLPATPAATGDAMTLTSAAVDAIHDEVVEGAVTLRQMMRGFAAALMGKASGLETTTAIYRDIGDTKDRIIATVDADGNRTAVTKDLT